MAFDFKTFGQTPETSLNSKVATGNANNNFDFGSFGSTPNTKLDTNFSPVVDNTKQEITGNPLIPAKPNESILSGSLKTIANIPSSAYNFAKGAVASLNPVTTIKNIAEIPSEFHNLVQEVGGVKNAIGATAKEILPTAYGALVPKATQQIISGDFEGARQTITNDPVGQILPFIIAGKSAADRAGLGAQYDNAISTLARPVTDTVESGLSKTGKAISSTAKFGVSQATGLNPETITNIIKNPQSLKDVNPEIRIETAKAVGDALDARLEELSGLGKEYQAIRESATPVTIPDNILPTVLERYGVKLDKENRIVTTPESRPLSPTDRASLQDFIDNYGSQKQLTSNSFLNVREALSNLSKFEQGKTNLPQQIARDLRSEYDAVGKSQIPGLKELDTAYSPERQLLSQLKRDIIDTKTGDLKDGAISKIANLTGKGKENVLARVKQIVPDIEERVNLIKTVEDIERASGFKTGTYIRGAITGGGVLTGNIPVIISAILSQPEIAVPLLKAYGYVGQKAIPVLNGLKNIANDVNNFQIPKPLLNKQGQIKGGMSIEDVSKKSNPTVGKTVPKDLEPLAQEARKYETADFNPATSYLKRNIEVLNKNGIKVKNPDEVITLYHGTNEAGVKGITESGSLKPSSFLATDPNASKGFVFGKGGKVLKIKVRVKDLGFVYDGGMAGSKGVSVQTIDKLVKGKDGIYKAEISN